MSLWPLPRNVGATYGPHRKPKLEFTPNNKDRVTQTRSEVLEMSPHFCTHCAQSLRNAVASSPKISSDPPIQVGRVRNAHRDVHACCKKAFEVFLQEWHHIFKEGGPSQVAVASLRILKGGTGVGCGVSTCFFVSYSQAL